jgi:hypothetical protein
VSAPPTGRPSPIRATFYAATPQGGFILYPGKLTRLVTFRVGCVGAIGSTEKGNMGIASRESQFEAELPVHRSAKMTPMKQGQKTSKESFRESFTPFAYGCLDEVNINGF